MESTTNPLVGRTIDQRYRIEAFVARGGMATVYRARDQRLDRIVALKIMHGSFAEDPEFVARFVAEARSAAKLSHPAIVAVYDQGAADGLVYLAMEYVNGNTLRDVLRERGRLDPVAAMNVFEPILSALTAAHNAGIAHRDIKPENVLVSADGQIKVADFGLARAVAADATSAATRGMLIGTVAYMAPEQVEHGISDTRTDVYAAGILLYECVVGQSPYSGDTPLAVAYQHVNSSVPTPSSIRTDIPKPVDDLVTVATSRHRSARYPDAGHFLNHVRSARALLLNSFEADESDIGQHTVVIDRSAGTVALAPATAVLVGAGAGTTTNPASPGSGATELSVSHEAEPSIAEPHARSSGTGGTPPAADGSALGRIRGPGKHRISIALIALVLLGLVAGGSAWAWGATQYVPIPSVLGLTPDRAAIRLAKHNLHLDINGSQFSETVPKGSITSTDPNPGGKTRKNGTVEAMLSKGPERHAVPGVAGLSINDAGAAIADADLTVAGTAHGHSDTVAAGLVSETTPASGSQLKPHAAVTLVVSDGPAPVAIPRVTNQSTSEAIATLQGAGLKATQTDAYHDRIAAGDAITTNPKRGTTVHRGDTVTLVISKGPPPVTVPYVVTLDADTAKTRLIAAGLRVLVKNRLPVVVFNRVYSQDPSSGTVLPKGSTVTITIV